MVFLDGLPLCVPAKATTHWEARGIFGIARGRAVCRAQHDDTPIQPPLWFKEGHTFVEGERYVSVDFEPGAPWEQDPDAWKS